MKVPTLSRLKLPRVVYLLAFPGLFVLGVMLAREYELDVSVQRSGDRVARARVYEPSFRLQPGRQLVMVYIGSSTCPWSNEAALPQAVEEIKMRLAAHASAIGMSFKAVGVAIDWSPELGMEHLRRFGAFDEISTGYNWGGTLALRYLWNSSEPQPSTPRVIVYTRRFVAPSADSPVLMYAEEERHELTTRRGSQEILDWADSGTFPDDLSAPTAAAHPRQSGTGATSARGAGAEGRTQFTHLQQGGWR